MFIFLLGVPVVYDYSFLVQFSAWRRHLLWHRAPLQVLRMTELFYSSIATDLDFPVALHSPVGCVPFAINVQRVSVVDRNLELQLLGDMVKA